VTVPAIGAIGGLAQSFAGFGLGETAGAGAGAASGTSTGLKLGAGSLAGGPSEAGAVTGLSGSSTTGGLEGSAGVEGTAGVEGSTGIGGSTGAEGTGGAGGSTGGEGGGFGEALTQAISSLEQSQQSASGAAQSLATGTAANPESAVVTVEDAQLAMQLASQIRNKAVEAAQQIFQTQV
jgi:flagellar hook-basal body complex protein FliE